MTSPSEEGANIEGIAVAVTGAIEQLAPDVLAAVTDRVGFVSLAVHHMLAGTTSPDAEGLQTQLESATERLTWASEYAEAARDALFIYLGQIGVRIGTALPPPPIAPEVADTRAAALEPWLTGSGMRGDHPSEAYYAVSVKSSAVLDAVLHGERELDARTLEELRHMAALEYQLCMALIPNGELPYDELEGKMKMYTHYERLLRERGIEADLVDMAELARGAEPSDTWEYFYGQLEQYKRYLEGEPLAGEHRPSVSRPGQFADLVHILSLTNQHGGGEVFERILREERLQQQVVGLTDLLFAAYKPDLAVPFGKLLIDEQYAGPFLDKLAATLRAGKASEDSTEYRRLFTYTYSTLPARLRERFIQLAPHPDPVELLLGSRRALYVIEGEPVMVESYRERQPIWAATSDGKRVPMPYTMPLTRQIKGYGTPVETIITDRQHVVDYETLDDKARQAIETMLAAQAVGSRNADMEPQYKQLTTVERNGKEVLYTAAHPVGVEHASNYNPTQPEVLQRPVRKLKQVSDGYMVVPYTGHSSLGSKFRDADANFSGPGTEGANAFWITGPALAVFAENDPRLTSLPDDEGDRYSYFAIVPVRYYQVDEAPTESAET